MKAEAYVIAPTTDDPLIEGKGKIGVKVALTSEETERLLTEALQMKLKISVCDALDDLFEIFTRREHAT